MLFWKRQKIFRNGCTEREKNAPKFFKFLILSAPMSFFKTCFTIRWIMTPILIAKNFYENFRNFPQVTLKTVLFSNKQMKKYQLFVLINIILVWHFFRSLYFYVFIIYTCSSCSQSFIKISRVNLENELFVQLKISPNNFFSGHSRNKKIFFFRQMYLWLAKKQRNKFELIYCFFTCTEIFESFLIILRSMVIIKWALNNNRN